MQWVLNEKNKELFETINDRVARAKSFRQMDKEVEINVRCRDCAHLTKESSCARRLNVSDTDKVRDCNWFKGKGRG